MTRALASAGRACIISIKGKDKLPRNCSRIPVLSLVSDYVEVPHSRPISMPSVLMKGSLASVFLPEGEE